MENLSRRKVLGRTGNGMGPQRTGQAMFGLALLATACGVPMEPEHPELASGEFEGWDWILAGEVIEADQEVCIELLVSAHRGSVGGGPICHEMPSDDDGNARGGGSRSGDDEIANVRAVVGPDVAEVRLPPGHDGAGETVWVKQSPDDPGWFVFLYDPRESDRPPELQLLDEGGNQLDQLDLSTER